MKRLVIATVAILYLTTSIGIVWHYHYCMGQLVRCEIWENKRSTCSQCGMPLKSQSGDNDCCRDEFKYVRDDKDQTSSDNFAALAQSKLLFASIYAQGVIPSLSSALPTVKGLPAKVVKRSYCSPPLNLINSNFRI
jgi:hypothetical protein